MKPVLIVEGKCRDVLGITWFAGKVYNVRVMDEKGVTISYHDINENAQHIREEVLQIDFETCLYFEGRYSPLFDSLDSLIGSQQKEITDLALQYSNHDTLYPDYELKKQIENLKQRTYGLMDAQDIVSEFMVEDVDLSGGEGIDIPSEG